MTMTLTDLEKIHGNFYVPAYQIKVDGKDLLKELFLEIVSVQIDNVVRDMDRFTFTVNSAFDIQAREFMFQADVFSFGNAVEISLGYAGSLTPMHQGIITELHTSFPASGLPQFTVSGYDHSYRLTKGARSYSWGEKRDSEVAAAVAGKIGLTPVVADTSIKHPNVQQNQESEYQLLKRLAQRNEYEFYVFNKDLVFRKPANDKTGEIKLEWGKGLVSFSPELNLAEQVGKVEVRGWDVNAKQAFVGKANQGDELGRDPNRRSGAEFVNKVCTGADKGGMNVRIPVYSQQDADRRAHAIFKGRSEKLVQGSGESIGLPEIRADRNIELGGMGKLFNRTYYIEQSTHTINSSGYKTTFKVKEATQ